MVLQVRAEVPPGPCPGVGDVRAQHRTFQVLGEPVIQELWRLLKKERDTLEPGHSFTAAPYKGLAGMSGLLFHPESPVHRGDTAPPPPDSVSPTWCPSAPVDGRLCWVEVWVSVAEGL